MPTFRGIWSIVDEKKWVFAYAVLALLWRLAEQKLIAGSDVALILSTLIGLTLGANSFDKSVWRKPSENKPEMSAKG